MVMKLGYSEFGWICQVIGSLQARESYLETKLYSLKVFDKKGLYNIYFYWWMKQLDNIVHE